MNYKAGYFILFNKISDLILQLESIQSEAEEAVVCDCDDNCNSNIKIIYTDEISDNY